MGKTLAIHWAGTTHGTWLHGDVRGSWREGRLIGPDPFLLAAAQARMSREAVILSTAERTLVAEAFGEVAREQRYQVLAATIQAAHFHLVLAPLREHLDTVVARFKRRSAGVVLGRRRENRHANFPTEINPTGTVGLYKREPRSLWTGGKFVTFVFTQAHLWNTIEYVRQHNRREGLSANPFDWIAPLSGHVYPNRSFPDRDGRAI